MSENKAETKKTSGVSLIYSAIPAIMSEIPSICKDRKNADQGYNFRGIDDVYNAVNPILAKHQVFMRADIQDVKREERPSRSGGILAFVQVRVCYSFVASDGSFVSTDSLGEGMDSGDKATAKAMSIAQKYALLQMFCIPTADQKDPENDNPEMAKSPTAKPQKKPEQKSTVNQPSMVDLHNAIIRGIAVIEALGIGQTIESIWEAIHKETKKKFSRDFAEASELSAEEAAGVVDYLRRWYRHVMDGRKGAAAKHAEEAPRPDEEYDDAAPADDYDT